MATTHVDVKVTKLFLFCIVCCLKVHYYNEIMGVWEPLLEPLEDDTRDGFRPWRLELKVLISAHKHSIYSLLTHVLTLLTIM